MTFASVARLSASRSWPALTPRAAPIRCKVLRVPVARARRAHLLRPGEARAERRPREAAREPDSRRRQRGAGQGECRRRREAREERRRRGRRGNGRAAERGNRTGRRAEAHRGRRDGGAGDRRRWWKRGPAEREARLVAHRTSRGRRAPTSWCRAIPKRATSPWQKRSSIYRAGLDRFAPSSTRTSAPSRAIFCPTRHRRRCELRRARARTASLEGPENLEVGQAALLRRPRVSPRHPGIHGARRRPTRQWNGRTRL